MYLDSIGYIVCSM